MKRKEYIERLEQLLLVLPQEERTEALQYYNDYFDDAGMENEETVIEELGSPEEVAAKIRAGYAGDYGEYSEQGYEDVRFQNAYELSSEYDGRNDGWQDGMYQEETGPESSKRIQRGNTNIWKIVAIGLLLLLAAPIVIPVGIVVVAVLFSILAVIAAVAFAIGISGFAVLFAGIVVLMAGIAKVFMMPAVGILAAGVGCLLVALGILLCWLIITLMIKVVPGFIRGLVRVLGYPFRKAGVK